MTNEELGRAVRVILHPLTSQQPSDEFRLRLAIGREPLTYRWIATVANYVADGPTPESAIECMAAGLHSQWREAHGFSCHDTTK